jgi:hypothetical protein
LSLSPGFSKSGARLKTNLPSVPIEKNEASVPLFDQVTVSLEVKVNTGNVFSGIDITEVAVAGAVDPPGPITFGKESSTLVTVTVSVCVVSFNPASTAFTTTTYVLLAPLSKGFSKSGAALKTNFPSVPIEKNDASVPLFDQVTVSLEVKVNTGVVFSGMDIAEAAVAGAVAPPGPARFGAVSSTFVTVTVKVWDVAIGVLSVPVTITI